MSDEVGALAHEVPYWGWIDERSCLTLGGELVTVGELAQVVVDGRSGAELDRVCERWQKMLSGLPEGMRVSWILERGEVAFDETPADIADIAALAQGKRRAFLSSRVQDVKVYVVWSYAAGLRQAVESRTRRGGWVRGYVEQWRRRRRVPHESVYLAADVKRAAKTNEALVGASVARVNDATAIRLLKAEEAAGVLCRLVNAGAGEWVRGQRTDAGVNWRMATADVAADRQVLNVGGEECGVWSCVAPPASMVANGLADLYGSIQAPMTVVLEWRPWARGAARSKMRAAQRHYFSKRYSMAAHMQEKEGTGAAMEDAAASMEAERAGAALVELETDGVAYGDVALSVVIRGSAERLDQWGAELGRVFGAVDAKVVRESYGQLAVWFGRLPGQPRSRQPRTVFVSAGVAATLAPLFGAARGERRCAHLNAPALTVFETQSGTPYYYDLFGGRDVGHTLMLGATGAGKSFTLNYLLVQALQYRPRVLVLDLGGSYRALTQFVGGGYLEVTPEKESVAMRPFALEPTERTIQFLSAWVLRLLRIGGWESGSGDLSEVRSRILDLYALPRQRRSLGNLASSLPKEMWPAMSRWHGSGAWGKSFDNPPTDEADLEVADWQVIDLAGAVEHEDWCEAALLYLLERLRAEIEDPKEVARLKLMVVDEAWRYLQDPTVLNRMVEAAKTWRKRNAALVLATQSVTDLTRTEGAQTLLESMPTRLFLANADFPEAGAATFGLSADELRTIRELEPKRELFMRRANGAAVLRLVVDPESYWLYTSSAGDAERRAAAVEKYGVEGAIMRLAAGLDRAPAAAVMG
jgi:type IV secretion system protein VirB4